MKHEIIQPIGKASSRNIGISKFQTSILIASQVQSSNESIMAREPYVPDPCLRVYNIKAFYKVYMYIDISYYFLLFSIIIFDPNILPTKSFLVYILYPLVRYLTSYNKLMFILHSVITSHKY